MGYFGTGSGDNDYTWDAISSLKDLKKPTAKEISNLLKKLADEDFEYIRDVEVFIGVVVFGLNEKVKIPMRRLIQALRMVESLIENQEYLKGWEQEEDEEPEEKSLSRKDALEVEGRMIHEAMQNKGFLPIKWLETVY